MNVVWFKRDLRLSDNEALFRALESNEPTLLLYIFEPSLLKDIHYSPRHFDFIKQSLEELQNQLKPFQTQILIVESEAVESFEKINSPHLLKIAILYPLIPLVSGLNTSFNPSLLGEKAFGIIRYLLTSLTLTLRSLVLPSALLKAAYAASSRERAFARSILLCSSPISACLANKSSISAFNLAISSLRV